MHKRSIGYILLANLIFSMFIPVASSVSENLWWDENWSFRQEIILPINTSNNSAKYHPIDIRIEFDHPCWAKNEREHSIRVIYQDGVIFNDLESQIYDLSYTDNNQISACSLVFLIPPEANGKEDYYVYYDDEEKSDPDYPDHVGIEESYYRYEPIQGFPLESRHFTITEDGYIVYAVAKEGKFMDSSVSQQVTKLKTNTKTVEPKNGELLVSFDMAYWYNYEGNVGTWPSFSTLEEFVSKEIFVDGNLMVKFGIVSRTNNGFFQTTAIYKYYYCPTEDKRICAHVKHEILKYPLPPRTAVAVFYATVSPGEIRCNRIEDLNFGGIPPYVHIYSEEERILTYELDPYPESSWQTVFGPDDDVDLGSLAWISVDQGKDGKAHALIFNSTDLIQSKYDEPTGVQVQVYEVKEDLLGVDAYYGYGYIGRNSHEPKVSRDIDIPEDFVVEFDVEFFSTDKGYEAINDEARMFQSLVKYQPIPDENVTDEEEPEKQHALTIYTRLPLFLSTQLKLSMLFMKKPCISVELYCEKDLIESRKSSRLPLSGNVVPEFENVKPVQIIKTMFGMVDWKNISLFRKARFTNVPPGRYIVKVWLENSLFGNGREFIGLLVVDLQGDTKTRIFCRPEGRINVSVLNQNENGVEDAWVYLLKDDIIVNEKQSDSDGKVTIEAPCSLREKYTLRVVYKGFLVHGEEPVRLGYITRMLPLEKTVRFDVHDLTINISDADGNAPAFDVDMLVTSDEMDYPMLIAAEKVSNGEYRFIDLYPAIYTLRLSYKSFEVEETVHIPRVTRMMVNLYNLKVNLTDNWGLTPDTSLDVVLACKELKKPVVIPGEHVSAGEYLFADLYPANYTIKLLYKSLKVEQPVRIPDMSNSGVLAMVFPATFNVTTIVYDARGNLLEDIKVVMMRGGEKSQGFTNGDGYVTFSLPPGIYVSRMYGNDGLIAERKIDVTSKKTFNIVTTEEPLFPFIIIGLTMVIMVISAAFLSYRKKDTMSFLKMLAVALAVIAVVSPWWMLDGSSSTPKVETSSGMFLIPPNLITITSTPDVVAGELASLDETFAFMISILPFLMVFGCICIVASMLFKRYAKNRLPFVVLLLGLVVFVVSMLMFFVGTSQLMEVGVGSFLGQGNLDIGIPGEGVYETLSCNWGPGIGFYLYLFSIMLLILALGFDVRNRLKKFG